MVAAAASLKLMARGTYGELSELAKDKLQEATDRIENTVHLVEDFLGRSLADRRPEAKEEDCLDITEDIVGTGPGRIGCGDPKPPDNPGEPVA